MIRSTNQRFFSFQINFQGVIVLLQNSFYVNFKGGDREMIGKLIVKFNKGHKNQLIDTSISVRELLLDRQIELVDKLSNETNQVFNIVVILNEHYKNKNIEEYNNLKKEVKEKLEYLSSLCSEYYDFVVENKLDKKYIKHAEDYIERHKAIVEVFNSLEDIK